MGLDISASACGRCHACVCVFVYICMRMHMGVGIYIRAFFCRECRMHFGIGVLDTIAWAGVHVTQVCVYANIHICEHSRCRLCTYVYIYTFVLYACICIRMRMCVYDIA